MLHAHRRQCFISSLLLLLLLPFTGYADDVKAIEVLSPENGEVPKCGDGQMSTDKQFKPLFNNSYITSLEICATINSWIIGCGGNEKPRWGFHLNFTHISSPNPQFPDVRVFAKGKMLDKRYPSLTHWCRVYDACDLSETLNKLNLDPAGIGMYANATFHNVKGNRLDSTIVFSIRSQTYVADAAMEFQAVQGNKTFHVVICRFRGCEISADVTDGVDVTTNRFLPEGNKAPVCVRGGGTLTGNMFLMVTYRCLEDCPLKFTIRATV